MYTITEQRLTALAFELITSCPFAEEFANAYSAGIDDLVAQIRRQFQASKK